MTFDNLGPPGKEEGPGSLRTGPNPETTHTTTSSHQDSQHDDLIPVGGPGGNGDGLAERRADLRAYLDACLGDTEGYLHVAVGSDPFINEKGKYDHRRWHEQAFAWPAEADLAEQKMLSSAEHSDVYVCPYLMRGKHRAKGAAVAHTLVHADIDTDLDLEKVRTLGGFAVASGTHRHAHVYVSLTESVTVPQHEALCRGLGKFLGAVDSKVSDNDVLRPPGTRNLKPTVTTGGPPTTVGWEEQP